MFIIILFDSSVELKNQFIFSFWMSSSQAIWNVQKCGVINKPCDVRDTIPFN